MKKFRPPKGRVLVLAPHPDDETIGCGGAVLFHLRRKDPVRVVFVTGGARRQAEARAAARVLGVKDLGFLGARSLTALLAEERPRVVYAPPADDPHPDHKALALALNRALKNVGPGVLVCRYEVWSSPMPDAVLDISRDFARKVKALAAYPSQNARMDFLAMIRRLNASRGLFLGKALYGEGFRLSVTP